MAQHHDPNTKAAVMAALLAGQSVTECAKEYNIPNQTIHRWRYEASRKTGEEKSIDDLVSEYLSTTLQTLKTQAEVFADEDWLRNQSASESAVLHGVLCDKAIRILEAAAAAEANLRREESEA